MPGISPSILSADLCDLARHLPGLEEEADWLHLDIMDGLFVPNISFGFPVLKSLRPKTRMFFDCHLMIQKPERFFKQFAEAGANAITFHLEATSNALKALKEISSLGLVAGIALDSRTDAEKAFPFLSHADIVLVMGVRAGFGSQSLIPKNLEKVKALKEKISSERLKTLISFDGGVNRETGRSVLQAGADMLVVGSAVFKGGVPAERLRALKQEFGFP